MDHYTGNFTRYYENLDSASTRYFVTTASTEINGGGVMSTEWKGIYLHIVESVNKSKYYAVLGPILVIIIIVLITSISASLGFIGYCYTWYRVKLRSLGKLFKCMYFKLNILSLPTSEDCRTISQESITMVTNTVYGVNNISMKCNEAYEKAGNFSPQM